MQLLEKCPAVEKVERDWERAEVGFLPFLLLVDALLLLKEPWRLNAEMEKN